MNEGVRASSTDIFTAQNALDHGSEDNRQAIIPMKDKTALSPNFLSREWGSGSMYWMGWADIERMKKMCENAQVPGQFGLDMYCFF